MKIVENFTNSINFKGNDRKIAKKLDKTRKLRKSNEATINVNNSVANINGTIYGGMINSETSKRNYEQV